MQPADIEAVKNAAAEGAAEAIQKAKAAEIAAAEAKRTEAEVEQAKDMADILTRFEALEAEQKRMADERAALEQELNAFNDDDAKAKELEAKLADLDKQMASMEQPAGPRTSNGAGRAAKAKGTTEDRKSEHDDGDDPLGGISN